MTLCVSGCCAFVCLVSTVPMRDKFFPTFTTSNESPRRRERRERRKQPTETSSFCHICIVKWFCMLHDVLHCLLLAFVQTYKLSIYPCMCIDILVFSYWRLEMRAVVVHFLQSTARTAVLAQPNAEIELHDHEFIWNIIHTWICEKSRYSSSSFCPLPSIQNRTAHYAPILFNCRRISTVI